MEQEKNAMPNELLMEQKESIKLERNSKGYNWSIRLIDIDLDRLEKINNQMIEKYGGAAE